MSEEDQTIYTEPGRGYNTVASSEGPAGDTGAVPVTGGVYQGPGTYEPDGTYHPFTDTEPDPQYPDPVPPPPPPEPAPDADAPDTHMYDHVGKPVVLNGEDGAKSAALIIGGYDGADYVNLLVWDDPGLSSATPSIFPRYLIQVEPGTEPGQYSEL